MGSRKVRFVWMGVLVMILLGFGRPFAAFADPDLNTRFLLDLYLKDDTLDRPEGTVLNPYPLKFSLYGTLQFRNGAGFPWQDYTVVGGWNVDNPNKTITPLLERITDNPDSTEAHFAAGAHISTVAWADTNGAGEQAVDAVLAFLINVDNRRDSYDASEVGPVKVNDSPVLLHTSSGDLGIDYYVHINPTVGAGGIGDRRGPLLMGVTSTPELPQNATGLIFVGILGVALYFRRRKSPFIR